MEIWNGLDEIPSDMTGSSVTIGVFDGVHRGHQRLIDTAVDEARRSEVLAVMVTFSLHPISLFDPGDAPAMLGTMEQRALAAEQCGIGALLVIDFDREFAALSPEEYFQQVLLDVLRTRAVTVGSNFFFGHKARGCTDTLRKLGAEHGVAVHIQDLLCEGTGDDHHTVCSTWIRERIADGDVAAAGVALGRPFVIHGVIEQRAETPGPRYAHANAPDCIHLRVPNNQALPADGRYSGRVVAADGGHARIHSVTNRSIPGTHERMLDVTVPTGQLLMVRGSASLVFDTVQ